MKYILIHEQSTFNVKRYFPKSNILKYYDGISLKKHLRNIEHKSIIYIIPKNITSDIKAKDMQQNIKTDKLFYINQWSVLSKELYEKYPAGFFYPIKIICEYVHYIKYKNIPIIVDIDNLWDCDEGYCEFFEGWGTQHIDFENDHYIYKLEFHKVPFIFYSYNELIYFDNDVNVRKCHDTQISDFLNDGGYHRIYDLSNDWFTFKKSILDTCDTMITPLNNKIKISIHVRSPCHFIMNVDESEFYQSFFNEFINVMLTNNLVLDDVICLIFGDSKYSINKLKNIFDENSIPIHIFNEDRDDLSTDNVDWCIQYAPKYNRYYGTIMDVCLMSKSDYIIGGKSNIIMYVINANKQIKHYIPKLLCVDVL